MSSDTSTAIVSIIFASTICLGALLATFRSGIRHAWDTWVAHRDHVAELKHPTLDAQRRTNSEAVN